MNNKIKKMRKNLAIFTTVLTTAFLPFAVISCGTQKIKKDVESISQKVKNSSEKNIQHDIEFNNQEKQKTVYKLEKERRTSEQIAPEDKIQQDGVKGNEVKTQARFVKDQTTTTKPWSKFVNGLTTFWNTNSSWITYTGYGLLGLGATAGLGYSLYKVVKDVKNKNVISSEKQNKILELDEKKSDKQEQEERMNGNTNECKNGKNKRDNGREFHNNISNFSNNSMDNNMCKIEENKKDKHKNNVSLKLLWLPQPLHPSLSKPQRENWWISLWYNDPIDKTKKNLISTDVQNDLNKYKFMPNNYNLWTIDFNNDLPKTSCIRFILWSSNETNNSAEKRAEFELKNLAYVSNNNSQQEIIFVYESLDNVKHRLGTMTVILTWD
ncbi:hypothetical protein [Mycoplasma phocimorsus]|uniref:hypothetical protein n=1 Tax=Mycoplasma phocimorsus TaxID=3045839 RepID=UPI0024C0235C|nr:hypothetical protein [Mycoplasma phocimorsus]MDJ1647929.1 hypothetical protein [Mycoplasma phocimorsus]